MFPSSAPACHQMKHKMPQDNLKCTWSLWVIVCIRIPVVSRYALAVILSRFAAILTCWILAVYSLTFQLIHLCSSWEPSPQFCVMNQITCLGKDESRSGVSLLSVQFKQCWLMSFSNKSRRSELEDAKEKEELPLPEGHCGDGTNTQPLIRQGRIYQAHIERRQEKRKDSPLR